MSKSTARAEQRRHLLAAYDVGGLTRRQFCEKHGLTMAAFDDWRRERSARPRLVPVELVTDPAAAEDAAPVFSLRLANWCRIECAADATEGDLARLIRAAERA